MFRFLSMRVTSGWRMFMLLALGLLVVASRLGAQGIGYQWNYPVSMLVSNTATCSLFITNLLGASESFTITNTFSSSVTLANPTYTQGSTPVIGGNTVIFPLGTITNGGIAKMTMDVTPLSTGYLTNMMFVATNGVFFGAVNLAPISVTNAMSVADLAVAINGPTTAIFTNDWMVYNVNVTNLGPASAPNVFLTNTLPASVLYKSVSPSNNSFTVSIQSNNVIFALGTLTNQSFRNFWLTVQPTTNAVGLPFVSVVSTNPGVVDPNLANNLASNNITVLSYLAGQLSATIASTQQYNPQNGLVEQSLLVSNTGTNAVPAVRVVVTGLTNKLYNALGTNNGNPFVVYAAGLDTNQSVNLLLQYAAGNYFSFSNAQLNAYPVLVPNLTPPLVTATGTNLNITRLVHLTNNGDWLIEFPSISNRTYTVVYSDNVLFSNAMIAPPAIVAPANRTQWIDYGPPATTSHPTNVPVRFYRVFLNP